MLVLSYQNDSSQAGSGGRREGGALPRQAYGHTYILPERASLSNRCDREVPISEKMHVIDMPPIELHMNPAHVRRTLNCIDD